jgi:hypothetical protein
MTSFNDAYQTIEFNGDQLQVTDAYIDDTLYCSKIAPNGGTLVNLLGSLNIQNDLTVNGNETLIGDQTVQGNLVVTGNITANTDMYTDRIKVGTLKSLGAPSADVHIQSSGPVSLFLEADTNNVTESDVPRIYMTQDGNQVLSIMGIDALNQYSTYLHSTPTAGDINFKIYTGGVITASGDGVIPPVTTQPTERFSVNANGTIDLKGNSSVIGTLAVSSNEAVGGTLGITGLTTCTGGLVTSTVTTKNFGADDLIINSNRTQFNSPISLFNPGTGNTCYILPMTPLIETYFTYCRPPNPMPVSNTTYIIYAHGNQTFFDNISINGTLGVTGNLALSHDLAITGNTTMSGTLGVVGTSTLSDLHIAGNSICDINMLTYSLNVTDQSTLGKTSISGVTGINTSGTAATALGNSGSTSSVVINNAYIGNNGALPASITSGLYLSPDEGSGFTRQYLSNSKDFALSNKVSGVITDLLSVSTSGNLETRGTITTEAGSITAVNGNLSASGGDLVLRPSGGTGATTVRGANGSVRLYTIPDCGIDCNILTQGLRSFPNTTARPAVTSGPNLSGAYEIRGYASTNTFDDSGFIRLRSGGGTNSTASFIDISGSSTVSDMSKNIVFGTSSTERMRLSDASLKLTNGLVLPTSSGGTPATLSHYEEPLNVFTITSGAFVGTITFIYNRIGRLVTMTWGDSFATCTTATTLNCTGGQMPSRFRPTTSTSLNFIVTGPNGGVDKALMMTISTGGNHTIRGGIAGTDVFTLGANCGIWGGSVSWCV